VVVSLQWYMSQYVYYNAILVFVAKIGARSNQAYSSSGVKSSYVATDCICCVMVDLSSIPSLPVKVRGGSHCDN
jgi:hypothetical protein